MGFWLRLGNAIGRNYSELKKLFLMVILVLIFILTYNVVFSLL
ncbi:hypothetical protein J2755_001659 [Methanohalophilus levihalophilus]|nr:hypothetical protein [Methanohalophilus levihalophilus]MBP2030711.1 hypothetical protein [Methanohalophilus levihalophilus]